MSTRVPSGRNYGMAHSGMATPVQPPPKPKRRSRVVLIHTDDVTKEVAASAFRPLARTFMRYVTIALILGLLVVAATVAQMVLAPWWTLYLRAIAFVRVLFLTLLLFGMCVCRPVHVLQLYGTGEASQSLVALRPVPLLAFWRILGYADLFVGRILPILMDLLSLATHQQLPPSRALLRIGVSVVVLVEYFVEVWLVHELGIWANVKKRLLLKKSSEK